MDKKKMLKRYFLWKITLVNKHTLMTVKIHFFLKWLLEAIKMKKKTKIPKREPKENKDFKF